MIDPQIFNDAKKFAAQFGGFLKAAEAWAEIGSLEQAAQEAQTRVDALRAQEGETIAAIAERLTAAERAIADRRAQADGEIAGKQARADQALTDATAKAAGVIGDAETAAERIRKQAGADLAGLRKEVMTAAIERDDLVSAIEARRAEIAGLDAEIAAKGAEHARVQAAHSAFKASVGL